MLERIEVPEGKVLLSTVGNYKFVGPTIVTVFRKLRLEPTFTDGTPWIYYNPEQAEAALANTQRIEKEAADAVKEKAKKAAAKKKAKKAKDKKDADEKTNSEGDSQ